MAKTQNFVKGQLAKSLITELGGVCQVARICEIASSSVCSWRTIGVPRARLMYLKLKYPKLKVWTEIKKAQQEIQL